MSNTLKYELQLTTAEANKQFDEFVAQGKKKVADLEKATSKSSQQVAKEEQSAFEARVRAQAKMLQTIGKEREAKENAINALEDKMHKDRMTNIKLEAKERDNLYTAYTQQLDQINKDSPNQSNQVTIKQVNELRERYEIEKKLMEQNSAALLKASTANAKQVEQIEKKEYQAKRAIQGAASRAYQVDANTRVQITTAAEARIVAIVANSAGKTTETVRREIQEIVDSTRRELAKLEQEAEKKGGAGYGSFTNNMFQVGQAIEDFNIGFQLNGMLGGLRGASNNVAYLLSQLEGTTGILAQLGFTALVTGAQVAIFMNDTEGAADASDEFTNSLIELRFGFKQLTDEALNYRKEVIGAITDTAMEGLEPFIDTMDALEAKQALAFKTEDAKQYADEIGRTATKLKDLVRAEKDIELAQSKLSTVGVGGGSGGDAFLEAAADWEARAAAEMELANAQDALIKRQQEYMRLAKELDLPELNAQLKEYAELETLLAQSTVDAVEEKRARYEELRQTMLETFEKARKEREQEIEDERQRANLVENTAKLIRTQAEAIQELIDTEAGRSASKEIDEILSVGKYKEIESLRIILKLQEKLSYAEGDQKKKIQSEIIKYQNQIVDNYDIQLEVIDRIVDEEEERLNVIKLMQHATDQTIDAGKDRLNQLKQEIRAEDQKLETYKKQLVTIQQQVHAHKLGGKLGLIGGKETLMNTEANSLIQNIQSQAEAHKKSVQAQVDAQNQLASAFGGVGVNADAYMQFIDAKAEWLISQVKAKQKEYTFLFNKQREEELKRESDFQMKMSTTAGTPEEKIAAIERAIKAQEDLRQLQLSQVGEGGQFGMDKLKQSEQTGKKIEAMYIKQAMLLKEASVEAEKQKQIKEQEAVVLEQNLLRLDELKKALADKDIISEMDVVRAAQIEKSMLNIAASMQANNLGIAGDAINQLGKGLGLPGFASGGVFDGNSPIIVGEKGPEIIFPQAGGMVLTNQESQSLLASMWATQSFGAGQTTNVSTNIGTVNIQGPPVGSANNLTTQLRNSRYAARARKR
jgi:hypothetical protein